MIFHTVNHFRKKRYSQVHLDYGTHIEPGFSYPDSKDVMFTSNGELIPRYYDVKLNKAICKATKVLSKPQMDTVDENEVC